MGRDRIITALVAGFLAFVALPATYCAAQPGKPGGDAADAAARMADFFGKIGDQIYDECIYELSDEQLDVQHALIAAYVREGASDALARKLAVKQIRPPKLSDQCERLRGMPRTAAVAPDVPEAPAPSVPRAAPKAPEAEPALPWTTEKAPAAAPPSVAQDKGKAGSPNDMKASGSGSVVALKDKKVLPQWDCAPGIDYVTIQRNGYSRKLTGGEICNPFKDVVNKVPDSISGFKLGYTIKTGRLFVISDSAAINGKTIAWAISGREVCRNNPDPDCIAAKAVGPLPPGEYSFSADPAHRLNFGPKTKRMVAGIYLNKLTNKERFSPAQIAGIKARGNIAIHVRLKGEMSEACLGLEPNGWAYVSSLIKSGRTNGVIVHIDEPHPQIAEAPPVIVASSFSLTSLFNN